MKVIFLDIDGVLNSQMHAKRMFLTHGKMISVPYTESDVDPDLIKIFNSLIEKTGAKVVISSSWRKGNTLHSMKKICQEIGIICDVIGITPVIDSSISCRGIEIRNWISMHKENGGEKIEDYVILDDNSDMLLRQARHFFQCDTCTGITENIAYRVARYLNKEDI